MSLSFERVKRWFRRTAGEAESALDDDSPVATPAPGTNPRVLGDADVETSTNAQTEGASDEPWPGGA